MALTWGDINGKTNGFIVPAMTDIIYRASPTFVRIKSKNAQRFEGGTSIRHGVQYAELNGGAFGRGGTFDTSYVPTDTALEVVPKQYYVNATLFGTDDILNRGTDAAMLLIGTKLANASGKMAKLIATDLFLDGQGTNSGTLSIDGLQAAIDNGGTYGSYGGITRSNLVANSTNNQGINGR